MMTNTPYMQGGFTEVAAGAACNATRRLPATAATTVAVGLAPAVARPAAAMNDDGTERRLSHITAPTTNM